MLEIEGQIAFQSVHIHGSRAPGNHKNCAADWGQNGPHSASTPHKFTMLALLHFDVIGLNTHPLRSLACRVVRVVLRGGHWLKWLAWKTISLSGLFHGFSLIGWSLLWALPWTLGEMTREALDAKDQVC